MNVRQLTPNEVKGWRGAASSDLCDCHMLGMMAWGVGDPFILKCNLEAYGVPSETKESPANSGLTTFAYMWRRFGPPWSGSDPHKDLASWTISTKDDRVALRVYPSGSPLPHGMGYLVHEDVELEHYEPLREWHLKREEWWLEKHPELKEELLSENTSEERKAEIADLYYRSYEELKEQVILDIGEPPSRWWGQGNWQTDDTASGRTCRAIIETMKDLLRPVFIRDVPINIFGVMNDSEVENSVDSSEYAGFPLPKEDIDKKLFGEQ